MFIASNKVHLYVRICEGCYVRVYAHKLTHSPHPLTRTPHPQTHPHSLFTHPYNKCHTSLTPTLSFSSLTHSLTHSLPSLSLSHTPRYRAAELKHGRIAMLAALGQITQYYVRLGDTVFSQVRTDRTYMCLIMFMYVLCQIG